MRERGHSAAELLGVGAITPDGLLLAEDGTYVRYLEVTSTINPLAIDASEAGRLSGALGQVAARLPDRQSLQVYVQATSLDLEELLAVEAHRCELAAGAAQEVGELERARAIRQLGVAQEQSIRTTAFRVSPLALRYFVLCPWRAQGLRSRPTTLRRAVRRSAAAHERAVHDCERHTAGVRSDLEGIGLDVKALTGHEVLDLLHARFDPDAQEAGRMPASFMYPHAVGEPVAGESAEDAAARAKGIARAVCSAPLSTHERGHLQVGESVEEVLHLSLAPEQTWLGWLLHLMQAPCPFVLSVHIQATERYRERMAQKRRFRRLYGVNRGIEQRGRPLDPDARLQEEDAAELTEELATSAGAGIYRVSIYTALRLSGAQADPEALRELCQSTARETTMVSDARIGQGQFAQLALWRSTLPLGRDIARRKRRYVSRNVGDTIPLVGTRCGSQDGIALGYAMPGRTLERLDPFDSAHPNHLMLVNGMSGSGKTMLVILFLVRAIAQGAHGFIIDRAGHFQFLASLIPGSASLEIGAGAHAINAWDVPDPACVGAEKIDYLLSLHAQLLGEHHHARDAYGLTELESNLLGLAISEVYARCAVTGEEPRELLLQEELERRYDREREDGSAGIAEALRNLSMRLHNYIGDGPYAYLVDRATTIPAGSPLVVFDTKSIPEKPAAAALFVICEYVKAQTARTRTEHLAGNGPQHVWSGRSVLVVDETWKLIERPATGRWFNELVRRSRHLALALIAISQQLSDFDCEYGRALLANASMQVYFRQLASELAYVKGARHLPDEAIEAISTLKVIRGLYSTAYVINGSIGEGTIQVGVGPMEYWIAATDPARDEHIRAHALQHANQESWPALELLVDADWQQQAAEELGQAT